MTAIDGWEVRKLTELAEYINGFAFKPDDWGQEGLPIIRIEQLKNPHSATDYYIGNLPEKNVIANGDLIFSWSASLFLRIWQQGNAALNQHLFKVKEKEGINKVFLKLFIEFYLPELTKASHGSTMQHITRKELEKFSALFPINKAEQTQIAAILSTIDQAIEQTEALIAKQQRIKAGLMQDLLTRGIDENGTIRSEATHAFKDSPLGRIPVEWEFKDMGSVVYVTKLAGFEFTIHFNYREGGEIIALRALNIKNEKLDLSDIQTISKKISDRLPRSKIHKNDILITYIGAYIGDVLRVEENNKYHLAPNIAKNVCSNKLYPPFFEIFLRSQMVQRQIQNLIVTTATPSLTMTQIRSLLAAFPSSINEQLLITEKIYSTSKLMNNNISK